MSKDNSPERKCVACGNMFPKQELFRLVKIGDDIAYDSSYKAQGRGAYVCRKKECLDIAAKRNSFAKSFKGRVDSSVIDTLYMELGNGSR